MDRHHPLRLAVELFRPLLAAGRNSLFEGPLATTSTQINQAMRNKRNLLLSIVAASLLAITIPAHSSDTCVAQDPAVRTLSYPDDIPEALLKALKEHVGDISPPGGAFNDSDVVSNGVPRRRVMFVWNRGKRYLIATERGGASLTTPFFLYEFDQKSNTASLVSEQTPPILSRCKLANSLITQK